ncbi:ASCH domain-containing protein [Candidatus Parcubacteria bacterium]|nr:ASCH domain-containing protein [Patescibacteria group bacterium]MBU4309218.1 ASCH domain-containing protein [Patescibacteria group bacterium]MBU4432129.1 ASCH domain-containing protein [Patescibacteria group bacterium]MBU4577579.1 ASCH domain-containing protein [Patescibacteria group bacterium]MCG2697266.1 ASCH domain-containing protein [Candidatus Parcubacteria bacterium]
MKTISTNIQEPYTSFVVDGQKTVEGRLNRGKFAALEVGDVMEMNDERTPFVVVAKNVYPTFREMLETEGIANVLPDQYDLDRGVDVYRKFYSEEEEKEFGVVALRIKKI